MSMDEGLFHNDDDLLEEENDNSEMEMDAGGTSENGGQRMDDDDDDEDDGDEEDDDDDNDDNNDNDHDHDHDMDGNEQEKADGDDGSEDDDSDAAAPAKSVGSGGRSESGKTSDGESPAGGGGDGEAVDSAGIRARALGAARRATHFDIAPMVAIPYAQQCHSIALSDGPKWLLTGGEDGFIRKYDFAASIDGKAPLTVAQKHNLIENVNKAGVIGSYWENEQPMTRTQIVNSHPKLKDADFAGGAATYEPAVNPVYSLAAERNGHWCLSGLLSGGISLYTMIYNEGAMHHYFHHSARKSADPAADSGHSDAVSVLKLNHSQTAFLSGAWDKTIREWDLHTGKTTSVFAGSTGQISNIQYRPQGAADLNFSENSSDVDSLFGSDQEDDDAGDANTSRASHRPDAHALRHDERVFMSSSIDGTINIWDTRASPAAAVLRLGVPDGTPPWCMSASFSNDGDRLYVGRRNSTVEEFSLRMPHARRSGLVSVPNVSKRLAFPKISGPVSALSVMPNDNFLLCGSNDNIRLYNLGLYEEFVQETSTAKKRATPFFVIPGHHGGALSNLLVEDTGRFMVSASGNRGWGHPSSADVVLVYSIDCEGQV